MRVSETRSLAGEHGELLSVRYAVEPRLLEDALEALANAPFPINPQLRHPAPGDGSALKEWRTVIEFPAYAGQIEGVADTLRHYGLDAQALNISPMVEQLQSE